MLPLLMLIAPAKAHYRDQDPQLVFQMSLLWGHFASHIEEVVGAVKFDQLSGQFFRGIFDRDLSAQVKLRPEGLLLEHFGFMQSHMQVSQAVEHPGTVTDAEFKLFKTRLQMEASLWTQHLSRVHEWHARTHEARHDAVMQIHNMRVEKVDAYCTECFPTAMVSQAQEARLAMFVEHWSWPS